MSTVIETDCMGDLLVGESDEVKHADHDQQTHGRRYGRLVPGDKMDLFPALPVKVHRGVMTSRASSPEEAVERVSDDWRGAGIGYGRHWATKPSTAERHAVGTHNLSSAWVFGKRPDPDGVYGVVITAHFPEGTEVREGTAVTMWAGEDEVDLPDADPVFSFEVWSIDESMSTTQHGVFLPQETKHAGPGGAPVHSTGTPQGVHGGGVPTGGGVRAAIFEGVTKALDIAEESAWMVDVLQGAIDSGQVSDDDALLEKYGGVTPLQLFKNARDAVPVVARAAALNAAKDPDDPVHRGVDIQTFISMRESVQQIEDKKFRSPLLLQVITKDSRVEAMQERIDEWSKDRDPLDVIRMVDPDRTRYAEDFKKEVQAQVVAQWKEDLVTADEAVAALNALGYQPRLVNDPGDPDDDVLADAARTLVATWAHTSNDRNPVALSVQDIAERHFKVEDAADWDDGSSFNPAGAGAETAEWVVRSALQGMYDRTQEWFAEQGVEEVTLYRGQREYRVADPVDPDMDLDLTAQDAPGSGFDDVRLRPLSSWSLSHEVARGFTADTGSYMSATVPVSKILSMPRTGFGCTDEEECVVLGGVMDVEWVYGED